MQRCLFFTCFVLTFCEKREKSVFFVQFFFNIEHEQFTKVILVVIDLLCRGVSCTRESKVRFLFWGSGWMSVCVCLMRMGVKNVCHLRRKKRSRLHLSKFVLFSLVSRFRHHVKTQLG